MPEGNKTNTADKPQEAPFEKGHHVVATPNDSRPSNVPDGDLKVEVSSGSTKRVVISTIVRTAPSAAAFRRASNALRGGRAVAGSDTKARTRS